MSKVKRFTIFLLFFIILIMPIISALSESIKLVEADKAYVSKETVTEAGQRDTVIRFRNPKTVLTFKDTGRGNISFDTSELGDFVIAKSLEEPLYHFAVVLDDYLMGVNHIIRGEDHISNTPRQILIQEALGAERPLYTHLPLVLAEDRSKLSKRRHGEMVSIDFYRKEGFLPQAINNYLALLGWNPGTAQELFTLQELIAAFDITKLHHAGAVFDIKKLRWINRQHLQKMTAEEFASTISPYVAQTSLRNLSEGALARALPVLKERVDILSDLLTLEREGELGYFEKVEAYPATLLIWKKSDKEAAKQHLEGVKEILEHTGDTGFTSAEDIKSHLWDYAEKHGRGDVLWPLRVALSGKERSPDPFTLLSVLGKEESVARVSAAIKSLEVS